jgi:uncharacterized protein YciI
MKWAAVIEYIPEPAKVAEIRPAHRAYLTELQQANKLVCGGPFLDDFGALIVYEAESQDEVEAMIQADPFFTGGVFVRWQLHPWKTVFVNSNLLIPSS